MFGSGDQKRRMSDVMSDFDTRIGPDARFDGSLTGNSSYSVAGTVIGSCDIDGVVFIEKNGAWEGEIKARVVKVAGHVIGDITASEKLVLETTANVRGKLTANAIAIAEGAKYDGKIAMDVAKNITRFTEKRTPADGN